MSVRDILLQLTSYPQRTPPEVIERAVAVAVMFDARITAAICRIDLPDAENYISRVLGDMAAAIAAEREQSKTLSGVLAAEFAAAAWRGGRTAETVTLDTDAGAVSGDLVAHARVRDLTIMPVGAGISLQFLAQDLIFGASRPVLLLPPTPGEAFELGTVVVAWDGSRAAARAAADALPFLQRAGQVRLLTVTGDKPLASADSVEDLRRNFETHGVKAHVDSEPAVGFEGAGPALARYCAREHADLLVMGAYGHTRFRDFVMGGATRTLLADTPLAILVSH